MKVESNAAEVEISRTMLTKSQVKTTFKDGEGKPFFSSYMLDTLIREGAIPHVRLHNRKILLCKETLEEWLREQEIKSTLKTVETNVYGLRRL